MRIVDGPSQVSDQTGADRSAPPPQSGDAIETDERSVRDALARLVASDSFRGAPQLCAFLTYIVETTLAGNARAIKGYTIATEAFGRDESFDPQADPIVRVEAMRLRRTLDAYYAREGADEPLRIVVPRGSYVPTFELRRPDTAPEPASAPAASPDAGGSAPADEAPGADAASAEAGATPGEVIPGAADVPAFRRPAAAWPYVALTAVLAAIGVAGLVYRLGSEASPATTAAHEPAAATSFLPIVEIADLQTSGQLPPEFAPGAVFDKLVDIIARFDETVAVDGRSPSSKLAPEAERYRLAMRLTVEGDGIVPTMRLTHMASGEVVWARTFPAVRSKDELAQELLPTAARAISQPNGLIFADLRSRRGSSQRARCVVDAYDYGSDLTDRLRTPVQHCLRSASATDAALPAVHAALAYSHMQTYAERSDDGSGLLLDRALSEAQRAVLLGPQSARAQQALMSVLFVRGDINEALAAGQRALELNPFDSDVRASLASRYIALGDVERGLPLLQRAYETNPAPPSWYHFYMFLAAYLKGDDGKASHYADLIANAEFLPGELAHLIVAQQRGDGERKQRALASIRALTSDKIELVPELLKRRGLCPEVVERLTRDLRQAGLSDFALNR